MALEDDFLCLVPVAIFHGALEISTVVSVEVGEDTVLVSKAAMLPLRRDILNSG